MDKHPYTDLWVKGRPRVMTYENINLRSKLQKFQNLFKDYNKVVGVVGKLDCSNHGRYYVKYKSNVYKQEMNYTFSSCLKHIEGDSIDIYISSINPSIVTTIKPDDVISGFNFEINSIWLVFLVFGIPILLFASLGNRKMKTPQSN